MLEPIHSFFKALGVKEVVVVDSSCFFLLGIQLLMQIFDLRLQVIVHRFKFQILRSSFLQFGIEVDPLVLPLQLLIALKLNPPPF